MGAPGSGESQQHKSWVSPSPRDWRDMLDYHYYYNRWEGWANVTYGRWFVGASVNWLSWMFGVKFVPYSDYGSTRDFEIRVGPLGLLVSRTKTTIYNAFNS